MREETDVCVGQLRQEVTSLQDMLSQARHQAEGQVSAKEDELTRFKLDLSKHQQQVRCCPLFFLANMFNLHRNSFRTRWISWKQSVAACNNWTTN